MLLSVLFDDDPEDYHGEDGYYGEDGLYGEDGYYGEDGVYYGDGAYESEGYNLDEYDSEEYVSEEYDSEEDDSEDDEEEENAGDVGVVSSESILVAQSTSGPSTAFTNSNNSSPPDCDKKKEESEFDNCIICFNSMDNSMYLPRMLLCGHTFCSKCLTIILQLHKSCPTCRKPTNSENVLEYPVNYILLEIINNTKDLLKKGKLITMKQHQEQLNNIMGKWKVIKPVAESLKKKIALVECREQQLQAAMVSNVASFDEEKSKSKLKVLEEIVEEISNQINVSNLNLITDVSRHCKEFGSVAQLVDEVRKGLLNNKKYAALLRIDGIVKSAKLTISDNYFCIHSFEKLREFYVFETFYFQDLLEVLLAKYESINAFFDCCQKRGTDSRKVMVQVSDATSFLGYRFLKHCTGEFGYSYKDRRYDQKYGEKMTIQNHEVAVIDYIFQLKFPESEMKGLDSYSKHFLQKENHRITLPQNSCYMTCQKDGSLDILCHKYQKGICMSNVIGPIVDFKGNVALTFKNASFRKIIDCGIAFKIRI